MRPSRLIDWMAFRTTKRYNVIKIKSLEPGYWDKDELLLHAVMQVVVDYVELELATIQLVDKEPTSFKQWLYSILPWYVRSDELIRSRELGLKELADQKDRANDSKYSDNIDKNLAKVTKEWAKAAAVIEEVYLWWKDQRPARVDPHECANKDFIKIARQYSTEDAKMLKRIIDVREFLWT